MCLASKIKKILALAIIFTFAFGLVFLSNDSSAQAMPATKTSVRPAYSFPSGVLGLKENRTEVLANASTLPTGVVPYAQLGWPSWDDIKSFGNEIGCANIVGAALSVASSVCDDTVVGSVVGAAQEAIECGSNIPLCITNWIYNVVGAGVGWVATGIVTLVTSTREECLPGGNGGSGSFANGSSLASDCEARIKQDYFPAGYVNATNLNDVMAKTYVTQTRELRAQLLQLAREGRRDSDEYRAARQQLNVLQGRTDDGALSEEATVGQLRSQNLVFTVPKSAVSSPTWDREYGKYVLIGIMLMVPMIIAAAIQALISGKGSLMLRAVVINLPLAILGMVIAPWVTRALMSITDSFSAFIISDVQGDVEGYFSNMSPETQATMGIPLLLGFTIVALVFIFAALLIWFILSMREASVALIAVFLPIALAASIWPALSKWSLRAIKLLVAAIISKVFIVGAVSLGLGTFTGATETGNISISHMIYGATIFFIAAFSPHLVMKFFDEIGESISAAGGTGALARGLGVSANVNGTRALLGGGGGGGGAGGGGGGGSSASMAQLGAELSAANGGTPAANAATSARISRAGGGSNAENIHAGAQGAGAGAGSADPNNMVQGAYDTAMGQANGGTGIAPGTATPAEAAQIGSDVSQAAISNGVAPAQAEELGQGAAAYAMNGPGAPGAPSPAAPREVSDRVHASTVHQNHQRTRQARQARRASTSFMTKLGRLAMNVSPVGNVAYGIGAAARRRQDGPRYR